MELLTIDGLVQSSGGTCHLTVATAQGVVDRIEEAAPMMTTGQLAAKVRELCIEADPEEAEDRYDRAVKDRRATWYASGTRSPGTTPTWGRQSSGTRFAQSPCKGG